MNLPIGQYFAPLGEAFSQHADETVATGARAYMKNVAEFYGIPAPDRRAIVRQFIATHQLPAHDRVEELTDFCWQQPQREWQYAGMEMVEKLMRRCDAGLIVQAEFIITHKSWWDTVDFVAPNIAGFLFTKYPEIRMPVIEKWMLSGNLWLQRSCLLHQLRYGEKTDSAVLFGLCGRLAGHPDFFIRKAIGWSLRQYSKFNADAVKTFVNSQTLSPLSRKEALKLIGG